MMTVWRIRRKIIRTVLCCTRKCTQLCALIWAVLTGELGPVGLSRVSLCVFSCFFCLSQIVLWLSVPALLIAWKDSSPKWSIMCRAGRWTLLNIHYVWFLYKLVTSCTHQTHDIIVLYMWLPLNNNNNNNNFYGTITKKPIQTDSCCLVDSERCFHNIHYFHSCTFMYQTTGYSTDGSCLFSIKPGFHYPSWWVTGFHYPSTQAVLTGACFHWPSWRAVLTSGNRA